MRKLLRDSARSTERVFSLAERGSRRQQLFTALVVLLMAILAFPLASIASDQPPAELQAGATWLQSQQAEDGGFAGFSGSTEPGITADAVIALVACGQSGIDIDLDAAMAYLESQALVYAQSGPGSAARLALAALAAGRDPRNINGVDPVAIVLVAAQSGLIGDGLYAHALGLLALAAADEEIPAPAIALLAPAQGADGSWAFDGSKAPGAGDSNTTALLIQALVATGNGGVDFLPAAVDYLLGLVVDDGFPYQAGGAVDANSTALVIQALIAVNADTYAPKIEAAHSALLELQGESGAFAYSAEAPGDNLYATVQALPALAGIPLPVLPVATDAEPAATPVAA